MVIWLCYECYYDGCTTHRELLEVFDCREKASDWVNEVPSTDYDWREYEEKVVT